MPGKAFIICFSTLVLFFSSFLYANNTSYYISFDEAEELALKNSHSIAAQKHIAYSAEDKYFAQDVRRLPSLGFAAQSMFQSKIGEITFPTVGFNKSVGDNINWSIGPVLNWVVWDTGQILNKARSLEKTADSEWNNLDNNRRQVLLNGRTAYIGVQLAEEQVRIVRESLALARSQYADVLAKKNAGTADLLDLVAAHQEVVEREKDLEEALGQLAVSKRDLVAALSIQGEVLYPDSVKVDPVEKDLGKLLPRSDVPVDIGVHPRVMALADKQRASELAARSTIAQYFPEVTLQGISNYEYPNLGESKTIQQNKLTLNLNVPILDWGIIFREARSQKYQARASLEQKKQTVVDLTNNVADTRKMIETYKNLRIANARAVSDAVEVARLTYESYQAGRVIFLDVQRANVKALSAKVEDARNDANLSVQIAKLLALATSGGNPDE